MKYEAWIEAPKGVRIVEIEAHSIRSAYEQARRMSEANGWSHVRGVNPIEEVAATREP